MNRILRKTPLGNQNIDASVATCSKCDSHIPHTQDIHTALWDSLDKWIIYPCPQCGFITELFYNRFGQLDAVDPANE